MGAGLRVAAAAAAVGALVTAACSPSNESTDGASQTLRVGVDSLPPGKGDPNKGIGSPEVYTLAAFYDALTLVDSDGSVQPALATEWTQTNPTTWRFTLRKNVTFSNGEKFDAAAVVAAYEYLLDDPAGSASVVAADVKTVSSVTPTDDHTVDFTTSAPDAMLPSRVGEVYIPAPGKFKELGVKEFSNRPIGTGPFKVDSWQPNKIKLSAFTDSWRKPVASRLEINALPDPAARLQALQSGQVDIAVQISPEQTKTLDPARAKADIVPAAQVMSLAFINTLGDSPLKNQQVRQALNYAVDKKAMADNLLLGKGAPNGSGVTSQAVGHNPAVEPYAYDPTKARQLLAQAGYPDGFSFAADVTVGSFPADSDIYQLMQQNLADVGVKVELNQVTFATWLERYLKNGWKSEAFGLSWNTLPRLDALRPMELFSCMKEPAFFCDKAVVPLLEQAVAEGDLDARNALLGQAQVLMHENPPALYLVQQIDITGLSAKLTGFKNQSRYFPYDKMTTSTRSND